MRDYGIVHDAQTGKFLIIFKDPEDTTWSVLERGLSESIAKAAVKGMTS